MNPENTSPGSFFHSRVPVLELINPRQLTPWVLLSIALGIGVAWLGYRLWSIPLWTSTLIVLVTLLPVGMFKWRDDRRRYGLTVMILSILLIAQGTHTIEHLVQWTEYHILYFTPRQSNGLLSPANSEWVHFIWNWTVLITVVMLIVKCQLRNFWSFLLLGVAVGHTFEHSYALIRFLLVSRELTTLNLVCTAQGLPGILGQDGWLARSPLTYGTFVRDIPGLTTAIRLDVHFWWNTLEMTLSLLAAHFFLTRMKPLPKVSPPTTPNIDPNATAAAVG
jgi:hypothetical protein